MLRLFNLTRLMTALCLVLAVAAVAFADTLRLKDGSIIKGRIVTFGGGRFTVVVGEGTRQRQMTFGSDEVESIQFDSAVARAATSPIQVNDTQPKKDPQFIETSSPPKNIPRVITTDPLASSPTPVQQKTAGPVRNSEAPTQVGRKPIEVSVKVMADETANGWTNSGFVVRKGQKVRVIGGGNVSLGNGKSTGPSGLYDVEDTSKLLKSVPTGALIAVIGDDNNEFIYIGSERTFTATRDGALFLGVNEGKLNDNSGAFEVRIEIEPA